jgi:two-component system response regulator NreC
MRIKIFLVDDHELFRQGIIALLDRTEMEVVGEANNGKETLDKLNKIHPDIVLLDISMAGMDGLDCARKIREQFPNIKILVLSMYDTESNLTEMINAGVKGYILKSGSKEELLFAIKRVHSGGMYISSDLILKKIGSSKTAAENASSLLASLKISERELEILKLIVKGYTNSEIGKQLFASVRTIETRRKKLLVKTKTSNTAMLIHFATVNGLV